ncbi:MAG: 4,5-dihydroxyphthalate decarboxylase [uncultured Arthrobacter sp.]|uniref:4,5-dihydroxyphthalate decarboxylase n=1 Tax=uncultured Arthrobacter sp. TaxID=114050 RepID=A0A6J4J9X1_9MICC|nr:hypothetical protein [uncultured Arthrobacter sp.]CAA9272408.1 MAG: 4,5-dihydroxyphthalate decarboxylase [uncultured Arthrobacter sp.]
MRSARPNVGLTLAVNDSDQVRDLVSGAVPVQGADLTCLLMEVEEIFFRFTKFREWDVSEMSFGKFCSLRGRGDDSLIGIPVFLSRSFRHSGMFVRHDGPVDRPDQLAGKRIGIPEWTVTATVYQRALLQHQYGLELEDITWVQGGINEPGRVETLPTGLPDGVTVTPERTRSLNQLMLDGDLDAMLVPHPPAAFEDHSGRIVQLFSDSRSTEQAFFHETGIFPIMHLVVVQERVHRAHPWLAANLVTAFTEAKDRSVRRLLSPTAPQFPLPWGAEHARDAERIIGRDMWPYGLEPNRTTIAAFLRFTFEQGLTPRELSPEELFPESVHSSHVI